MRTEGRDSEAPAAAVCHFLSHPPFPALHPTAATGQLWSTKEGRAGLLVRSRFLPSLLHSPDRPRARRGSRSNSPKTNAEIFNKLPIFFWPPRESSYCCQRSRESLRANAANCNVDDRARAVNCDLINSCRRRMRSFSTFACLCHIQFGSSINLNLQFLTCWDSIRLTSSFLFLSIY